MHGQSLASVRVRSLFVEWLAQPDTEVLLMRGLVPTPRAIQSQVHLHLPKSPTKKRPAPEPAPPPARQSVATSSPLTGQEARVPRFFDVYPVAPQVDATTRELLAQMATDTPDGLTSETFQWLLTNHLKMSKFMSQTLFERISEEGPLSKDDVEAWLASAYVPHDPIRTFFFAVKQPQNDFIEPDDLQPFIMELLTRHEGMNFLAGSTDFQSRFCQTIVSRIFYALDPHDTGRITLPALSMSSLVGTWKSLEREADLNSCRRFFSYEHFYVIYCKFWEADLDHDFKLDRQDLFRYDGHAFHKATVDRIFDPDFQSFRSGIAGTMDYSDYICECDGILTLDLIINDEDKTTDRSLEFWFRFVDLDGDGVIRRHEIAHFHEVQLERLEALGHEVVSTEDILCQLNDMLQPSRPGQFTLADFKRHRTTSGFLFNMILSLTKCLAWENRDPYNARADVVDFPEDTDWDRFCRWEYDRLVQEDES
ncbi:MAG: uncharacterized protein KVP18_002028 [Porospora cf. gigantea A]|uniref:uncharacterized protein n=1 Tax=Porospora cf. gigantea A TaxID=2853593 RepID=UPI0035599DC6|nr:MAG: hypothetical protein KVP18_002028 [Porospora cf. gigantea A]